jgi:hypothetical protein
MKLEDIKVGSVLWNQWTYSIMGRDTDVASTFFIVKEVLPIEPGNEGKGRILPCRIVSMRDGVQVEKSMEFSEAEIKKGWLRFATKSELQKLLIQKKQEAQEKINNLLLKAKLIQVDMDSLDGEFSEFIEKAL